MEDFLSIQETREKRRKLIISREREREKAGDDEKLPSGVDDHLFPGKDEKRENEDPSTRRMNPATDMDGMGLAAQQQESRRLIY